MQTIDKLEYYLSGPDPEILVHAGIHGDEGAIIPHLTEAIKKYEAKLPRFLYVPYTSPSAIETKTRANKNGLDLNRNFSNNSLDAEVIANIELVKNCRFKKAFLFHMDLDSDSFYMYDYGNRLDEIKLSEFQKHLEFLNVKLLDGIDDPTDPTLGHTFYRGYAFFPYLLTDQKLQTFDTWCMAEGITSSVLIVEIPGKISSELQNRIIDEVVQNLMI